MPAAFNTHIALVAIKLLHTLVWAVFASAIIAIPLATGKRRWRWVWILSTLAWAECAVLLANHGRCPLTDMAAGYTQHREPNFDIYLPLWLAIYNKLIFGCIFVAGEVFACCSWFAARGSRSRALQRNAPEPHHRC